MCKCGAVRALVPMHCPGAHARVFSRAGPLGRPPFTLVPLSVAVGAHGGGLVSLPAADARREGRPAGRLAMDRAVLWQAGERGIDCATQQSSVKVHGGA